MLRKENCVSNVDEGHSSVAGNAGPADASGATDVAGWLAALDAIGEDRGYFQTIGDRHWAFFIDESPTLIVSFERVEDIRSRPDQMPQGYELAKARGWSHLCLIADGETWYRDKRVYGYFDRLIDDAFFEDFDQVLFMGAGVEGYAAAAFSVASPGASVIAINPRATLLPEVAGWDHRSDSARRLDFTSRFGYAPDMVEGAGRVYVIHDPEEREDAMHAALFRHAHVTHLRAPRLEGKVDWALAHMGLLQPLIDQAIAGTLDRVSFAKLWRARRHFGPYLRLMLARTEAAGRPKLELMVCRSVNARLQAPRFRKRMADLLAAEAVAEVNLAVDSLAAEPQPVDNPPGAEA
jgi:hypothetical protein